MTSTRRRLLPVVALVAVCALPAQASEPDADPLFDSQDTLAIELEAPWRTFLRQRHTKPTVEGVLTYAGPDGRSVRLDARVKARGQWRLEHCETPPLTIKLSPEQVEDTIFEGKKNLFVTTQCHPSNRYRQHLFQEYLIYRIYRELTDRSLRARLLEIDYRDSESGETMARELAFMVEDINQAAARMNRHWLETPKIRASALDPEVAALLALFQYLIGNTDWSFLSGSSGDRCCHNVALLARPHSETDLWPLPFDFDAAGLVNTGDVRPSDDLPIKSVRQRLFRGLCLHNSEVQGAVDTANRARNRIEDLLDSDIFNPKGRVRTERYLRAFYEIINDPAKLEAKILSRCRG
jgi:hypothetical protein